MRAMNEWARTGAAVRLAALEQERAVILKTFPGLRSTKGSTGDQTTRRRFSASARRRMSAGMRKYWAKRKAAAKV